MRGVLTFARAGLDVSTEMLPLREVIGELQMFAQASLKQRNIAMTWDGPGPCVCICNRQGVAQAGINLILNAADAVESRESPKVHVQAYCDANSTFIAIEDSGPGVPEELRDRIFMPFFTTKAAGEGTGLGLSVSRQMIRAIGGEIELSTEPSSLGGARFVIRLAKQTPMEPAHADAASEHPDRR